MSFYLNVQELQTKKLKFYEHTIYQNSNFLLNWVRLRYLKDLGFHGS